VLREKKHGTVIERITTAELFKSHRQSKICSGDD